MPKLPALPHVKYVRAKNGQVYAYFNTGQVQNGRPIRKRLPDPASPSFYDTYAAYCAGRQKRKAVSDTFGGLVDDYLRSVEYRSKAAGTQKLYAIQLGKAVAAMGSLSVDTIAYAHLHAVLDKNEWGAGSRNMFIAAIGAVYQWARQRGRTERNPTKDFVRAKGGQHEPWPEVVLEAALRSDDDFVRLAVHLLYFTGQRISDVCVMRWNDIRDGILTVTQRKTRKTLEIPVARELQTELERTPKRSLTILTGRQGRPISPDRARAILQAFTTTHGVQTVPHGLRKNAVIALLEFGCTIAEVAAITGQTYAMVEHYAARVNNRRLGESAILKFDAGRNANRKTSGKKAKLP